MQLKLYFFTQNFVCLMGQFSIGNVFFCGFAGGHGHHGRGFVDPFELFRSFFGTGDPFNAFDHFGMHSHHHPHHLNSGRTDPWYRRHLLAKRLRLFCPKISPEYTDPKILSNIQRTTSCWLWYRLPAVQVGVTILQLHTMPFSLWKYLKLLSFSPS